MKIKIQIYISIIIVLAFVNTSKAQDQIKIGNISPGKIAYASFQLKAKSTIHINTIGACFPDRNSWFDFSDKRSDWQQNLVFYGWILNSKTRKIVWHFINKHPEILKKRSNFIEDFNDKISLPAGNYEIYYTGAKNNMFNINGDKTSWKWLVDFMGLTNSEFDSRYSDKLYMTISAGNNLLVKTDINKGLSEIDKDAVFKATRMMDNEFISKQFSLNKTTTFNVYTIGEGSEGNNFDYAWIYSLDKNTVAWMMNYGNTTSAGGAKKNMEFANKITLPAGNYKVCYKTDDSHSLNSWNSYPPDDPFYWGIVLKIPNSSERQNFKEINNFNPVKPIVQITKVGDDQYRSQGFSLKNSMDIHIICLGEGTDKDNLVDFGQIIDADSREIIWEMNTYNLKHGGGAKKNRMVDETIHLEKGNYIVRYVTDGSHSYYNWNATEPFDPYLWGITIWANNNSDVRNVNLFNIEDYKNKNILTKIIRVRDNSNLKKSFILDKEFKVRIFCLGEGTNSSMVDYGWIEDRETGEIVWDMSYKRTVHAGGSKKNRMINQVISLPKGNYNLYYISDDSHSFNDWNANPPNDQDSYGITISIIN